MTNSKIDQHRKRPRARPLLKSAALAATIISAAGCDDPQAHYSASNPKSPLYDAGAVDNAGAGGRAGNVNTNPKGNPKSPLYDGGQTGGRGGSPTICNPGMVYDAGDDDSGTAADEDAGAGYWDDCDNI